MIISDSLEQTIYLKMTKVDHWISKTTLLSSVWDIEICHINVIQQILLVLKVDKIMINNSPYFIDK